MIRLITTNLIGPFVSQTDAQSVLTAILASEPDHMMTSGVFSVPKLA